MDTGQLEHGNGQALAKQLLGGGEDMGENPAGVDEQHGFRAGAQIGIRLKMRHIARRTGKLAALGIADSGNALDVIQGLLEVDLQLGKIERCVDGDMGDGG